MLTKSIRVSLLVGIFLFQVCSLQVSAESDEWWNDAWSFRQELSLGSIIHDGAAANQPIDLSLHFDTPCWAENATHHSIRVLYQNKNHHLELESQLYDLTYSEKNHLTSC
ncbi:MAG: hypothetical protein WC525_01330, partial [Candidatus Thermoplasmatota archaeon]